jgi:hypothetical protein
MKFETIRTQLVYPTIVGIISASLVWQFFQKETSVLELTLITRAAVVDSSKTAFLSELKITFDEQPVKRLDLFSFSLVNTGTRPILPEDFREDVIVNLPGKVLTAYGVYSVPRPLIPKLSFTTRSVSVKPALLNHGDRLLFNVVVADADPNALAYPNVLRVANVPDLVYQDLSREGQVPKAANGLSILSAALVGLVAAFISSIFGRKK